MSDTENEQDADFPAEDDAAPEIEVQEEKPARSKFKLIAWLILFLVVVAAAALGYLKFQEWRAASVAESVADNESAAIVALRNDLRSATDAIAALEERVRAIPDTDNSDDIAALKLRGEYRRASRSARYAAITDVDTGKLSWHRSPASPRERGTRS